MYVKAIGVEESGGKRVKGKRVKKKKQPFAMLHPSLKRKRGGWQGINCPV